MKIDASIWKEVEVFLGSGARLALVSTGGGGQVASWLLNHPGASRALLEVQIPYCEDALAQYLEAPGPHRVAEETARALAARAYARARSFSGGAGHCLGLGCTAALATLRPRRGEDRAWIALRTRELYHLCGLHFAAAAGRTAQEEALSRAILRVLLEGGGVEAPRAESGSPWLETSTCTLPALEALEGLLQGRLEVVEMGVDGGMAAAVERRRRLLFPGSFNPLHQGHEELAAVARAQSGRRVDLELSVYNADKPPLSYREVLERLEPLEGRYRVVLTRAPTFAQKARLFEKPCFVVGADTLLRLFDPRYYGGENFCLEAAMRELFESECTFLVAGRVCQGRYRSLEDLEIPRSFRPMFRAIPQEAFRRDISSTAIRAQRKNQEKL